MVRPHVDNHGFGLGLQRSHIYWISFTALVLRLDRYSICPGVSARTLEILLHIPYCHTFL